MEGLIRNLCRYTAWLARSFSTTTRPKKELFFFFKCGDNKSRLTTFTASTPSSTFSGAVRTMRGGKIKSLCFAERELFSGASSRANWLVVKGCVGWRLGGKKKTHRNFFFLIHSCLNNWFEAQKTVFHIVLVLRYGRIGSQGGVVLLSTAWFSVSCKWKMSRY